MNNNYKILSPFKLLCLQNFPFIEANFDALTEYELLCKIVEYINKISYNQNLIQENFSTIEKAFNELKSYVDNFFDTLDVQEEINNKLNEMVTTGELENIISQYIQDPTKLHFIKCGDNNGNCTLIETPDKNILVDLSNDDTASYLVNYLVKNNLKKIDYIFLTHYDNDHIGGQSASGLSNLLTNASLDFSNCVAYLPHKDINFSKMIGDFTNLENTITLVKNILESHNINYIEPEDKQIIQIDSSNNIQVFNIGENYYLNYYDVLANEQTNYNNFSMIIELNTKDKKTIFPGDIDVEAEEQNMDNITYCDVYLMEHHGVNTNVSYDFMNKINPKYAILMNTINTSSAPYGRPTFNIMLKNSTVFTSNESGNIIVNLDTIINTSSTMGKYNELKNEQYEDIFNNYDNNKFYLSWSRIAITQGDLNNYTKAGCYFVNPSTTGNVNNNVGESANGKLIVLELTSWTRIQQIYYVNMPTPTIYTRLFNGTDWTSWNQVQYVHRGYVRFTNNEVFSNEEAQSFQKIPLTKNLNTYGSGLTVNNNNIVIGEGVSKVRVSAQVVNEGLATSGDRCMLAIYQNQAIVNRIDNTINNQIFTLTASPIILNVAEGDIINFQIRNITSGKVSLPVSTYGTYLEVEVIE